MKNPPILSFRGAGGDEESRKYPPYRARFLAPLGMTLRRIVFHQPARAKKTSLPNLELDKSVIGWYGVLRWDVTVFTGIEKFVLPATAQEEGIGR
jgi:hypothetical protein